MKSMRKEFALLVALYGFCGLLVVPCSSLMGRYLHTSPPAPGYEFRGAAIIAGSLVVLACAALLAWGPRT